MKTPREENTSVAIAKPAIGDVRRVRGGIALRTDVRAGVEYTQTAKGIIQSIGR